MTAKVVTGKQMKQIDQYAIEEIGIPSMVLMERAALSVAEHLIRKANDSSRILAVCGTGNNGADGIAAARILFLKGYHADVLLVGDEEKGSEETKQQLRIARNIGMDIFENLSKANWQQYSFLVDALFGIGLSREVEGDHREAIENMNRSSAAYVLSVDIASGLSGTDGSVMGSAVRADATVTFGWKKSGMVSDAGKTVSGEVIVADIGYPDKLLDKFIEEDDTYGETN